MTKMHQVSILNLSKTNVNNRPKIHIELTNADKMAEGTGWLLLACLWLMALYAYYTLPQTIPIHFNMAGEPDNYGSKATLFALPVVGSVLYIFLTWLSRHPEIYNYPTTITETNAPVLYRNAARLIRVLKLVTLVIFAAIIYYTYRTTTGQSNRISPWFLPAVLSLILLPLLYFLAVSFKKTTR